MQTNATQPRYYAGLDTLRAIMMILGVFVHGATFVRPGATPYQSIHGSNMPIVYSIELVMMFRMSCFFILCGFLAATVLNRKDAGYFLRNRKERVLIPLVSSLAIFIILPDLIVGRPVEFTLEHLWFLLVLLMFSAINVIPAVRARLSTALLDWKFVAFFFCVFCVYCVVTYFQFKIGNTSPALFNLIDYVVGKPLYYSVFYALGFVMYRRENLQPIERHIKAIGVLAIVFAVVSLYYYHQKYVVKQIDMPGQIIKTFADMLAGIAISLVLFHAGLKIHYTNKTINFFKDASLIIYVAHYPIIFALAPFVDQHTPNVYAFYFSLCGLTLAACVVVYILLEQTAITRKLFGIRRTVPPQLQVAAPAGQGAQRVPQDSPRERTR